MAENDKVEATCFENLYRFGWSCRDDPSIAPAEYNNALTWQVNGIPGGGTTNGTIIPAGLYAAPAALPMTGNTVTITAVSQADTTKTASSVVTLTSP
jgi:hypothetical protein